MTDPFPSFEVVPAVDMQDGEVVQLVQGERGTEKRYGDPVDAARRWVEADAATLHLVDLDGAFEGERANADAVEAVVEAVDVPVQLGGGIRTFADAADLLDRAISRDEYTETAPRSDAFRTLLSALGLERIESSVNGRLLWDGRSLYRYALYVSEPS